MLELMPPFYFLTFAKVSVSVSKKFGLKKVSVSVSKTFGLEKKSRYRSRKHLVSKKVSVSVSDEISGLATQCRHQTTPNYARQAQIKSVFVNKTDIKLQK